MKLYITKDFIFDSYDFILIQNRSAKLNFWMHSRYPNAVRLHANDLDTYYIEKILIKNGFNFYVKHGTVTISELDYFRLQLEGFDDNKRIEFYD